MPSKSGATPEPRPRVRLTADRCLDVDGRRVELSRRQGIMMEMLLHGYVVSYEAIEDMLWPIDADRVKNPRDNIKAFISHLRRRVHPVVIVNIRERGYRLLGKDDL